jgi:ElaB/YqjD/DUF883 family membrane-anchored ribosome-binding protein
MENRRTTLTDDTARIAELTASAIRSSMEDATKQIAALTKSADETAAGIVKDADAMVKQVKDALERTRNQLKMELKSIADDMKAKSDDIAKRADAFIRHCAESSLRIAEHHAKINGTAAPRAVPAAAGIREGALLGAIEREVSGDQPAPRYTGMRRELKDEDTDG